MEQWRNTLARKITMPRDEKWGTNGFLGWRGTVEKMVAAAGVSARKREVSIIHQASTKFDFPQEIRP